MSPAELTEWAAVLTEAARPLDGFEDMKVGEEVED